MPNDPVQDEIQAIMALVSEGQKAVAVQRIQTLVEKEFAKEKRPVGGTTEETMRYIMVEAHLRQAARELPSPQKQKGARMSLSQALASWTRGQ